METLSIKLANDKLYILDQRELPSVESWLHVETPAQMAELIKSLAVRGAPLIGMAAAFSLSLYARDHNDHEIISAAKLLRESRPTAVNLAWAIDRLSRTHKVKGKAALLAEAEEIFAEDRRLCEALSTMGAELIKDGDSVLTHCNTGALATAGAGTALGVIRRAHEQGKNIHVYVDETRPLLQGARLTAWELSKLGIPYTLICDNMAAFLMAQGKVNCIFVGADRIAMNGDFANKIGTYSLAVSAHHHQVPFYAVAPRSTVDFECPSGSNIQIELRPATELREIARGAVALELSPKDAPVYNPAFDVTPTALLTALILDCGVYSRFDLQKGILKSLSAI